MPDPYYPKPIPYGDKLVYIPKRVVENLAEYEHTQKLFSARVVMTDEKYGRYKGVAGKRLQLRLERHPDNPISFVLKSRRTLSGDSKRYWQLRLSYGLKYAVIHSTHCTMLRLKQRNGILRTWHEKVKDQFNLYTLTLCPATRDEIAAWRSPEMPGLRLALRPGSPDDAKSIVKLYTVAANIRISQL